MLTFRRAATGAVIALTSLDAYWKILALRHLQEGVLEQDIGGVFGIMLHKNYGVIANTPIPLSIVIPVSALILIGCGYWLIQDSRAGKGPWPTVLQLGLVTLILGASGNLVDRVVNGFTTDFLILFGRSVVNIADGLILIGVALIIFSTNKVPIKPPTT